MSIIYSEGAEWFRGCSLRKEIKMAENKVYRVVCQKWLESERGWGTRPDGYSLHLTDKEREQFIKEYWDRMPDQAPDEYSRDDGDPYVCEVSEAIFKKIKESRNGIRCWGTAPYPGGTDGWIPLPSTSTKLDRATIEDLNKKTTGRHGLK